MALVSSAQIDVAIIRGTTADEDGNVTMDGEIGTGEVGYR